MSRVLQGLFPGGPAGGHARASGSFSVDPARIGLAAGRGRTLPEPVRRKMEAALGADFSGVRIHVGPQAERIGAIAFTIGADIYFAPGRFQPDTPHGQQLLGHELTHVVQQRQGRVRGPGGPGLAVVQDRALEAEADRLGNRAAQMTPRPRLSGAPDFDAQPCGVNGGVVRIAPVPVRGGWRLTAEAGARRVGSVMVRARDARSIEVTDLGVDTAARARGVGTLLLASAARTGLRRGKSVVSLAAEDDGSGRLTRWYRGLGFAQVGRDGTGQPRLEAPLARLAAAGNTIQRAKAAKVADKERRQQQQANKDRGALASQAAKDAARAPKVAGFVAKAQANAKRQAAAKVEAPALAATWKDQVDAVMVQVRALRAANPGVRGINAGTNHGIGNTAGGTGNPLTLALSAEAIRLGLSKTEVGGLIAGFDNSDSSYLKFRSADAPPILVHWR